MTEKKEESHRIVRREDYRPPDFWIDTIELSIDLHDDGARVESTLAIRRRVNEEGSNKFVPLVLDAEELKLVEVRLNGENLPPERYKVTDRSLTIQDVPASFSVSTVCTIKPQENTALQGLYVSNGMFFTQCEPEEFRRITYFIDRPDVMASYRTTIEADKTRFPLLLSNGNLEKQEDLPKGRHRATWNDPYKKPSYLFAMVAGDFSCKEDSFVTCSGRQVALKLFTEPADAGKVDYAMTSLKEAMSWDERTYGREYDLDTFMIVAVRRFNPGAMENKGLNIFNSSFLIASPKTQTDFSFEQVESCVGHEYFHNWSGDRVTCRDWFQLSLKEGFTVFREYQFCEDMNSGAVKRINEVSFLKAVQFPEDAGPLAHPVRPDSYVEIDNFYSTTVYQKGAEVVRMLRTLFGPEGFRKGTDLYFERNDGCAVTCDDLVQAIADANGASLEQFMRWYDQAGTPRVAVERAYDAAAQTYTLTFKQSCPATPGQSDKKPFIIPMTMGLLGADGSDLPLRVAGIFDGTATEAVLSITEPTETFVFEDVAEEPVPSLLRGFSAPVIVELEYTDEELAFQAAHDGDTYNRWASGQLLAQRRLLELVAAAQSGSDLKLDTHWVGTLSAVLEDSEIEHALQSVLLGIPTEGLLAQQMKPADTDAIHTARDFARSSIAASLRERLQQTYDALAETKPYEPSAEQVGKRSLRNACLGLLSTLEGDDIGAMLRKQFVSAKNMTDQLAALRSLVNSGRSADSALESFYDQFRERPLVIDQWFSVQAANPTGDAVARVRKLIQHPDFDYGLPNRVHSVVSAFCGANQVQFHRADGGGYDFLADQVITVDAKNPALASKLAGLFSRWQMVGEARQALARAAMQRVLDAPTLSSHVRELLTTTLAT